ncbi:hypothetical protein FYZ48_20395 [Gimesia chilikensis]|uniref:hypothetical protein n=1 Tax=Gimesia chilikensis TaxID=2605989 RepID=UPI0011F06D58|nr:hypothetical protein [Gimesia chilikensis]KAA0134456.1 hypothetical protein FYZ48_20395 [Gimesia chilikensis]
MTQQDLDQAVATATGEDVRAIRQRGFSLANPLKVNFDPEPDLRPPQSVDWDELSLQQNVALFAQRCGRVPGLI